MSRFLDRVLAEKAHELARLQAERPLAEVARQARNHPPRDFREAIAGDGRIIAEIKRRSPSVPSFRQSGAPEELARIYAASGAAAISIVTDQTNFGTSLADVERVRATVALPLLVKDFVIDPYQVFAARAAGADAVLLIARILSADTLRALLELAGELGIAALVECRGEIDLARAVAAGADVIGINNRDLDTLAVSLSTAEQLLPRIPRPALRVAESGIATRRDIERLLPLGVHAFLVGGVLLNADDPGAKLRELRGQSTPTEPAAGSSCPPQEQGND